MSDSTLGACPKCHEETETVWAQCWRCQKDLGCRLCSGTVITEVCCWKCAVWGTLEALLQHGPIINEHGLGVPLVRYPATWQSRYLASEQDFRAELARLAPQTENGKVDALKMADVFKGGNLQNFEQAILEALQ